MTTIIVLTSGESGADSLSDINANYAALNAGKAETSSVPVFVYSETPSGSGTSFTLANTPVTGTVQLYRGGARQKDSGTDYTISGANITLGIALAAGEVLLADYRTT